MSLNKGTAAMLVSPTNPLGIELYSYASVFLKNMFIDHVSENTDLSPVKTAFIMAIEFNILLFQC